MNLGRAAQIGSFGLFLLTSSGCATSNPRVVPDVRAPVTTARTVSETRARPDEPDWTLTLATRGRTGTVHVTIRAHRGVDARWAVRATMTELEVRDAKGARRIAPLDGVLTIPDDVTAPFDLSYEVAEGGASACAFEITPDRAVFCGDAVLARPIDRAAVPAAMRIALVPDRDLHESAASSFGPDAEATAQASFDDAARAAFVFGRVGRASFTAVEGRDHAAWVDSFSFDPRWVAAEAAGVRTSVDRWLGLKRPADDPSVGLVFLPVNGQGRDVAVRRGPRGAIVDAQVAAQWSARARVELTRLFVQRTLGPVVTVGEQGAPPESRLWFDEGVAHAVALDVLRASGIVTEEEAIAEVGSWLAEEADSPHRALGEAALVQLLTSSSGEDRAAAARLLAVRGAIVGLSLARGELGGLAPALRALLADVAASGRGMRTRDELYAASKIDATARRKLDDALRSGGELPLDPRAMGPCAKLERATLYSFELGFTLTADGAAIDAVRAGSAADKAGLAKGDVVRAMDLIEGRASRPVHLATERNGKPRDVRYLPRGAGRPGRAFKAIKSPACTEG